MDGGLGFAILEGGVHDQLPEIFMTISIYNGQESPIYPE